MPKKRPLDTRLDEVKMKMQRLSDEKKIQDLKTKMQANKVKRRKR